jgi:hypothetical protein
MLPRRTKRLIESTDERNAVAALARHFVFMES